MAEEWEGSRQVWPVGVGQRPGASEVIVRGLDFIVKAIWDHIKIESRGMI